MELDYQLMSSLLTDSQFFCNQALSHRPIEHIEQTLGSGTKHGAVAARSIGSGLKTARLASRRDMPLAILVPFCKPQMGQPIELARARDETELCFNGDLALEEFTTPKRTQARGLSTGENKAFLCGGHVDLESIRFRKVCAICLGSNRKYPQDEQRSSGEWPKAAAVGLWSGQQERQQRLHFIPPKHSLRRCLGRRNC
jgi:hypothetical protein